MMLWWKVSSPRCFPFEKTGEAMPPLIDVPESNWKVHNYNLTNILIAVDHLQLEVCKSSQGLFKHPTNKNHHHNYLQNHIKSISTCSLWNHQRSNNFLNIRYVVCSKSMRSCMHCECWIPVHCDATMEWERSGKVRNPDSESIVTQTWVKPHAGAGWWRHKRRLKTPLMFVIALFANLGDLDQILQLGISDCHSTFCKWWLLASTDISQLLRDIPTSIYALKMLRPGQMSPLPPGYATVLKTEPQVYFKLCIQPNILKLNQATKTVILTYTSKQKP